jgi:tetratricopeptide (TPR) repeat protein
MSTVSDKYLKVTRIFIASPGDLNTERAIFPDVIEKVNRIKAKSKGMLLEAVGWEDTLPGKGRPQEKIDEDVKHSDLIVMLLWKRWGSATGKYSSGFEEEYEVACANDKEIWLYFRGILDDMLADPGEQLQKVLEFRNKVETEKKFLFRRYEDENAWKEQFIEDLCRWLDNLPLGTLQGFPPDTLPPEKVAEYEQRIEQLERELGRIRVEQVRSAYTWVKEAWEQADAGHITKAEEYFARAVAICQEPRIGNSYGLFLMRIGALKKAEERFVQTMKIGELIGDKVACANAYGNLGNLYLTRGDLKAAEEMYKKSLAIDKELGREEGIATAYCNLGILYRTRGDLKAAEEMGRKSLAIEEKLGLKEGIATAYCNLGVLYKTRGDIKAAEEMYKKSLAIDKELGRKEGMAAAYCNLGNLYVNRGDLKVAEKMYKKSLAIEEKLGRKEGMATVYCNLGVVYKTRGDVKAAEDTYKKSLSIEEELGLKEGIAATCCNLGVLYKTRGDIKAAEEMYERSLLMCESLGNKANIRKIQLLMEELEKLKKRE